MFRRSKPETPLPAAEAPARTGGKGRPTPTRKEAEAAARARARAAANPKAGRKQQREARAARSREIREGMKAGDARYLPRRDQGPVRAYVRDIVDGRLSAAEAALPLLLASLLASSVGQPNLGAMIMNGTLLIVAVDTFVLRFQVRRAVRRRFGEEHLKGVTFYAMTRALQLRFMRMPKAQVKLGNPPRERL